MKKILLILVAAVFSLNIYAQPKFEKLYQGSEAVTSLDNDYFAVKRNGKWGVMKGRIQILDFYYDSIDVLSDGVITFIRNNQAGFADTSGNIISLADYSLETPYNRADESALNIFQSGSALVYDGTKLILLGKDGKQINDDQTEVVSKADNCVIFKKKAAYGLMDAKGRVLAENKYRRIQTVVAGELYAYTASKDGMDYLGLIDAQGNVKSAAQYEDLTVINKGDRFYVKAFVSSGKQALYSSCGDLLIQPLYQNTEPTDNADYYIFTENSRKGLLNSEYIKLIPAEYDNVSVYDKDGNIFFIARNEDMTYIFGKDGKLRDAVSGNIKDFVSFNNDELLYVADSMLNYGIRSDKRGWVVNPQYLDVFAQAGDNLVVRQKDKWGAVDYSGNVNVEFEYKKVRASKSNSCVVFYEGKNNSVILTHDAKIITFPKTDKVLPVDNYVEYTYKKEKVRMDLNGREIKNKYKTIGTMYDGVLCVQDKKGWTYVDAQSLEPLTDNHYTFVTSFDGNFAFVVQDKQLKTIDKEFNITGVVLDDSYPNLNSVASFLRLSSKINKNSIVVKDNNGTYTLLKIIR